MNFSGLPEGCPLTIHIRTQDKQKLKLKTTLKKYVREDALIIALDFDTDKPVSFENVSTDLEYSREGDLPILWRNVKVFRFRSDYVVQIFAEGTKHNRRNTFRVGVSLTAKVTVASSKVPPFVTVRDISLTGFSISDRKHEISLQEGDMITIFWEDIGHTLNLTGKLIRIEQKERVTIYGFETYNLCKDLASYINTKQRLKRSGGKR